MKLDLESDGNETFGSGSGCYKFGGLQDSEGYKSRGLQAYALRILRLPRARTSAGGYKIRGATSSGGLQGALRILGLAGHEPVLEEL